MDISKRVQGYIDLALEIAKDSEYGKFRHGAILVKGGTIRNTAHNKDRYCSFGSRFRHRDDGHATLHAELGCVLGLDRGITSGSTVYVARLNRMGEARISKPCSMCQAALSYVGVRKVVYTTSNGKIESINLQREE
jgi:tRNA(Arg) A34 adenosine deaminase TadA